MKNIILIFGFLLSGLFSCVKVPNEGIPTYIKLEKSTILTDSPLQGSSKNQFSDLWIESNGISLGAYELPVTFAALLSGENEIIINPGIKMNGSSFDRRSYPIFEPFKETFNFIPKDTIVLNPTFKYRNGVEFIYIEDFENTNNFDEFVRTNLTNDFNYDGKAGVLTLANNEIEKKATTISSISISKGKRVYVELTLKSESYVGVGFRSILNNDKYIDIAVFNPNNTWTTTYFEITSFINSVDEGTYNFYVNAQKNSKGLEEKTYFDNFKIIQF